MDELIAAATSLSSASLHEAAGRVGTLPARIKPLSPQLNICGRALPVRCACGDNLWLHRAIYEAQPGEVLVVEVASGEDFGYWGEVMAVAAQVRSIAGLVIDGGVRDSRRMIDIGFPVCAATICIRGTVKRADAPGSVGEPIQLGGVDVRRGDLVFGDADGVVVIPQAQAVEAVRLAQERDAGEAKLFERLRAGERTIDIYGPAPIGEKK